ncbi:MAG: type III-A CRISPR-associated protein Cas10/Csm1 [Bacteroidales bacterium]|nr:type III-A CRISPR-associated protein Cas10/Csm1 [Bacteroidales bacterium]
MATREEIYLAALLHDIGKFWQRADENGLKNSRIIASDFKHYESEFCPTNEKGLSHKHVMWTAYFIEKYKAEFISLLKTIDNSDIYGNFMHLAAKHHHATTIAERIIQKADHYSAGLDRTLENGWKDAEEEDDNNWDAFKRIQLRPIFAGIGNINDEVNFQFKAPISSLELSDSFIEYKDTEFTYRQLWELFEKEFKFIQTSNFKAFTESLLSLLHKYTVRIPASTKSYPDVSLYDHLKTTAAFAISLYDYINETGRNQFPTFEEKPFMLIGGDLSGIQKFIYTIAARGAAKNLKGRSFYLQLLIENIVQKIIDELNLFSANIIYQSGGGFFIIAPNTDTVKNKIRKNIDEIEEKLFKYHKTDLYIAIEFVEFGEEKILNGNIGFIWNELREKLKRKKNQRFKHTIVKHFNKFFEPDNNFEPDSKRDYITGEILDNSIPTKQLDEDNADSIVNAYTFQQIELGKKLKDADFWI